MSHFLAGAVKKHACHPMTVIRSYACVKIELHRRSAKAGGDQLHVHPGIFLIKPGSTILPLPDSIQVIDSETKEPIPASGRFFVTSESLDPFHLLLDALPGNEPWR